MSEIAPLCDYCPLRESCSELGVLALANLREKTAEIYYDEVRLELSDLPEILVDDHDTDEDDAYLALECLNKIYRDNCPTSVIGHIGGNALGVVARAG
ncbi:MAG TPA: hypothetical protein VFP35_03095 [Candidatus Saccharimonadales bacterium]|nr:hypothetical protein [Candidatus Saccharimonadales bacterium]